jgi:hypothetical protein
MAEADRTGRGTKVRYVGLSLLVLACLATRLFHVHFESNFGPEAGMESGAIARNLVDGHGYSLKLHWGSERLPTVHMPPGVPVLLASLYRLELENPHLVFQWLQVLAACLTLICIWALTRDAFSEPAAWVAGGLYVLDLNLSFTATWVNETALNILFVYLGLWLIVRLDERPRYTTAFATGILFALGALVRPVMLLILALSLLWLALRRRHGFANLLRHAVVIVFTVALLLAPWAIRNYRVTGRFVPICSNWAINLWLGYNPAAGGSQFGKNGRVLHPTGELAEQLLDAKSEVEMDDLLAADAWNYIRTRPVEALKLRPYCFLCFWLDHNYWLEPMPFPVSNRIRYANYLLVALTAVALLVSWRRRGLARLLLTIMLSISFFYAIFHADIGNRFRMQIEPIMLMFIGNLLTLWWVEKPTSD